MSEVKIFASAPWPYWFRGEEVSYPVEPPYLELLHHVFWLKHEADKLPGSGDYDPEPSFQMSLCLSCREPFYRYLWHTVVRVIFRPSIIIVSIPLKFAIIIRHESGLNRSVTVSSNRLFKVFLVPFVHFVSTSAFFLTSCCSSFFLHVVGYLVSRQPVLFSTLPKFLHSFCGQKGVPRCSSFTFYEGKNFVSIYRKLIGTASTMYIFILENFWPKLI